MAPSNAFRMTVQEIVVHQCATCTLLGVNADTFSIPETPDSMRNFRPPRRTKAEKKRTGKTARYCADCGALKMNGVCRPCHDIERTYQRVKRAVG